MYIILVGITVLLIIVDLVGIVASFTLISWKIDTGDMIVANVINLLMVIVSILFGWLAMSIYFFAKSWVLPSKDNQHLPSLRNLPAQRYYVSSSDSEVSDIEAGATKIIVTQQLVDELRNMISSEKRKARCREFEKNLDPETKVPGEELTKILAQLPNDDDKVEVFEMFFTRLPDSELKTSGKDKAKAEVALKMEKEEEIKKEKENTKTNMFSKVFGNVRKDRGDNGTMITAKTKKKR